MNYRPTSPLVKVGTALIGPDTTGNARGANAIDIQSVREFATDVVSDDQSVAIGRYLRVSGDVGAAGGYATTVALGDTLRLTKSGTAAWGGGFVTALGNRLTIDDAVDAQILAGNCTLDQINHAQVVGDGSTVKNFQFGTVIGTSITVDALAGNNIMDSCIVGKGMSITHSNAAAGSFVSVAMFGSGGQIINTTGSTTFSTVIGDAVLQNCTLNSSALFGSSMSYTGVDLTGITRVGNGEAIADWDQVNLRMNVIGCKFYPPNHDATKQTAAAIYAGTGVPNNANGANGDFYFRSDGGAATCLYQKRAGAWVATGA